MSLLIPLNYNLYSYFGQERKLLDAAKAGRVDEVASILDHGVDVQYTDWVGE